MNSITYGQDLSFQDIRNILHQRYEKDTPEVVKVTVGTDSQTFSSYTKMVGVIAIQFVSRGGFFFFDCNKLNRPLTNIYDKLRAETSNSLQLASEFLDEIILNPIRGLDDIEIVIHSDIGKNGPTSKLIPEIVGWITACGFTCEIKPNSFAASTIADRISK